jgi:hypothetical protein
MTAEFTDRQLVTTWSARITGVATLRSDAGNPISPQRITIMRRITPRGVEDLCQVTVSGRKIKQGGEPGRLRSTVSWDLHGPAIPDDVADLARRIMALGS